MAKVENRELFICEEKVFVWVKMVGSQLYLESKQLERIRCDKANATAQKFVAQWLLHNMTNVQKSNNNEI